MTSDDSIPPRVFISYSWTSDEHTEWVADLGSRLMADGIDVVLDQWSLKEGQDLNSFMEQMVTDTSIRRVIIVSDAQYAHKATTRKGGVGTESQIISQEVYEKVDQEKFIPLVRERGADGKPCLPVFLKSRKYIDFSDPTSEADAYDKLIRNIHGRPVRRKPALGKPPSHLFEDEAPSIPSAHQARRFRDIAISGKGNSCVAFDDFAAELIANYEDLRLVYSREQEQTWCQTLLDNIERARPYRDLYVDVIQTGVRYIREDWFLPSLHCFLEGVLPYQFRREDVGVFVECSEDNYRFILYELFLYTIAVLIKARRFGDARLILDHHYVAPETRNGQRLSSFSFRQFKSHPRSLEEQCANRGGARRVSVVADLLHDRANRPDIRFPDLLQAEIVCCIAASKSGELFGWYPRSLIYAGGIGKLELFVRATNEQGYEPLKTLLQFTTPSELLRYIYSEEMTKIWHEDRFVNSVYMNDLFNLEQLKRIWMDER